jgi:uncharacterized protein
MKTIILALGLGFGIFSAGAIAAETPRSVSVSGSCLRSVIPDRGSVTLTVDAKDADAKRAQTAASRQYESLRTKIGALRLADAEISTVEFRSEEIREWEKDRNVSKGFRTRMSLKVETSDISRLGEVTELASREGIKEMGSLTLFVSTKRMMDERMGCLKEASEQAKAKADTLAKALGAKVGEVLTINEDPTPDSSQPVPMMRNEMAFKSASAAPSPAIEPGRTEFKTTVHVAFGLK